MAGMISKRWIINYLLIILIIIFTYIGNRYQVETGFQPENRITTLKPQDINRISIQLADYTITLTRKATQWQIDTPVKWPANNIVIERILSIALSETESSIRADGIDLATLGLQFPTAILSLNDTQFLFGATNNIGQRRYVMTGSTVYLISDIHLHFFSQGLSALIDRRLLPRTMRLQNFRIGSLKLSKTNDNGWQNDGKAITPNLLDDMITKWQTLEASRIQSYQKTKIPKQRISATLDDGSKIEFFLMDISPEIIIARPDLGLQYHFSESQYYGLLEPAQE